MQVTLKYSMRAFAAAMLFAAAQLAQAHAHMTRAEPAVGAAVAAPKQVTLEFDDALEPAFSSVEVTDAAGKTVTSGKSRIDGHDKKRMSVDLETLTPGTYRVKWVAVAADGHRTERSYTFDVKH
ncbi:copper homeostasis periplasmic binding protein CopC [Trinickia caryophylli]|uniref:CopC domain-containing protein n=1 Tax=Trinickia caryophylli TaxID=28094 RepID=A0A1X7H0U6_TRICW|nr:copper homeostasis periplasmic binding protein CopC [Trinickia caryophylli]PMS10055.1 copper resistance protein [Trinickia caryophylli]TRX18311.1 copper homeostasis periplasmic binding protein CopC [Trinickia caryophylli]WQE10906.1 copper homeostasis periplasmic binding protein CopC [Trinickia caryophylli]SMF77834.1 hypothetical protein SAMN06295900_12019 [Trinickia caryophylli]